jgi:glycosyltransferase involved in cell wall biosynthesis
VDRDLFRPGDRRVARRALDLPEQGGIITFVGSLDKRKGLYELLSAFEQMDGAPTLVLVGDGPARRAAEQAAARLEGRIVVAGARPLAEVARYLTAADVLTLPSYAEGTPNVVLEALASARPIVATPVGGIPDVVDHGRTGLLVPVRDVPALAAALAEALARPWDARAFAAATPPSWDESAARLHQLLERAASGAEASLAA